jgi:hypothetical protein
MLILCNGRHTMNGLAILWDRIIKGPPKLSPPPLDPIGMSRLNKFDAKGVLNLNPLYSWWRGVLSFLFVAPLASIYISLIVFFVIGTVAAILFYILFGIVIFTLF